MTPEVAAAILGVSPSASTAEIHAAYARRARLTHPDRFAGAPAVDVAAATAEFLRVKAARDVLCPEQEATHRRLAGTAEERAARSNRRYASFEMDATPAQGRVWIA